MGELRLSGLSPKWRKRVVSRAERGEHMAGSLTKVISGSLWKVSQGEQMAGQEGVRVRARLALENDSLQQVRSDLLKR